MFEELLVMRLFTSVIKEWSRGKMRLLQKTADIWRYACAVQIRLDHRLSQFIFDWKYQKLSYLFCLIYTSMKEKKDLYFRHFYTTELSVLERHSE